MRDYQDQGVAWIVQQLREAFPYESGAKFLILDHDAKYGAEVPAAIRSMAIKPVRTMVRCPWQNGVAERWVGNCRRELLDHVMALNESHLKRLIAAYVSYYHQDRTHYGLAKQTPDERTVCTATGKGARSSFEPPRLALSAACCARRGR